jgi:hypothetical protein
VHLPGPVPQPDPSTSRSRDNRPNDKKPIDFFEKFFNNAGGDQ